MAKDDYFVIACRILSYLYACLKAGERPDIEYLSCGHKPFDIGEDYWAYIIEHLALDGYIEGVRLLPLLDCNQRQISHMVDIRITPKGIEYLQENSTMRKTAEFLKTLKESIPGL